MPKVCKPFKIEADTKTKLSVLMLRRIALESLGWRLWCEDSEKTIDHTHYVYWVGPNGEQHAHWWSEGTYAWNPNYHWFPPEFPIEKLLEGYDWQVNATYTDNETLYRVTIKTSWTNTTVTDKQLDYAVYLAIVIAFDGVPDQHRIKPYKEAKE